MRLRLLMTHTKSHHRDFADLNPKSVCHLTGCVFTLPKKGWIGVILLEEGTHQGHPVFALRQSP